MKPKWVFPVGHPSIGRLQGFSWGRLQPYNQLAEAHTGGGPLTWDWDAPQGSCHDNHYKSSISPEVGSLHCKVCKRFSQQRDPLVLTAVRQTFGETTGRSRRGLSEGKPELGELTAQISDAHMQRSGVIHRTIRSLPHHMSPSVSVSSAQRLQKSKTNQGLAPHPVQHCTAPVVNASAWLTMLC